jgi:hypothetical protein
MLEFFSRYRDILEHDCPDYSADTAPAKRVHDQLLQQAPGLPERSAKLIAQLSLLTSQLDSLEQLAARQRDLEAQLPAPAPAPAAAAGAGDAATAAGQQAPSGTPAPAAAAPAVHAAPPPPKEEEGKQLQLQLQPQQPQQADEVLSAVLALADTLTKEEARALAARAGCSEDHVRRGGGGRGGARG